MRIDLRSIEFTVAQIYGKQRMLIDIKIVLRVIEGKVSLNTVYH